MIDKIIYCNDLEALKTKLKEDGYYSEESSSYNLPHTITPIKYKDNTSLSLVRDCCLDLSVYTMLEDLGTYDDVFSDDAKCDKYKSVWDFEEDLIGKNEDGSEYIYHRPKKIGAFA